MTSASKPSGRTVVAVRQTPSTATESPSRSSPAKPPRSGAWRPPRPRSIPATAPSSSDDPGEHQPLTTPAAARARACPRRCAPTRPPAARSRRRRARSRPPDGQRPAGAEHHRGDEHPQLVDLARREQRAGQLGPALDQQRGRARGARARRARPRAGASRSPASSITSAPASRRARDPRRVGAGGGEDVERRLVDRADQRGVEPAAAAFESNTTRAGWRTAPGSSTSRAVSSGSSASAVPIPTATASASARQRWTRARLSGPEIHLESPLGGGGEAVEADRGLQRHQRQAGAGVLAKRLHQRAAPPRPRRRRRTRPRPPRRGGSPGRARMPSRSGRRSRSPPGRSRRRGSPRCRAAGGPGERRARGVT